MQVINNNGEEVVVISTRGVAEMMGIGHWEVLRKLDGTKDKEMKGIIPVLTEHNFVVSDYFIQSTYKDNSGKTNKEYLCTKLGCDFLANKFTGEKGIIFTAKYVKCFHEMEEFIKQQYTPKVDSYMISDPVERAKRWIEEQEEKRALELVNKEQQEVIEKQEHKINEQNDSIRNLLDISDLPYETIRQRIFEFMRPRHTAYGLLYSEFDLRYGVRSGIQFRNYKEKFLERYDLGEVKKKEMIKSQLAYICDEMEMAEELYLVMEDIFHDDFLQFLRSKIDDLTFSEVA